LYHALAQSVPTALLDTHSSGSGGLPVPSQGAATGADRVLAWPAHRL